MKQGWEIKKLGEVCDIINGRNQKKVENPNGKYPIYGSGGIMGYADDFLCRAGTTIIGRKGSINKPLYVDADFWKVDTAFGIQPKCCVDRFIYYLCKSIDFTLYDKGVTIPSLVKSDLLQIPIPVPERAEQERIVGELDCLSGIIANKRAQLRELDSLAQSIFYTMFGDPITNDKGWQTKKLGEITEQINGLWVGKNPPFVTIAVIRNTNFTKDCNLDTNNIAYIQVEQKQYSTRKLKCGDIIIEKSGGSDKQPVGRPILFNIEDGEYSFSNFTSVLRVVDNTLISPKFLHKFLVYIYNQGYTLNMQSKTTGIRNLNFKLYKNMNIPIPPIALQNEFAEKIENIERQKELITKSIKETEDLFNSRMSYYFD